MKIRRIPVGENMSQEETKPVFIEIFFSVIMLLLAMFVFVVGIIIQMTLGSAADLTGGGLAALGAFFMCVGLYFLKTARRV